MKAILSLGLLAVLVMSSGCWSLQRAMHEIRWADIEQAPQNDKADSTDLATN